MGSLAPQDMKGTRRMVIRRSFSFSIVLAPMTAGTVQPNPMSMGMNALPERPKCRSVRSMTKAARAIYPLSSSMERNRKSRAIMGRKVSTPPTPEISPSTSRPLSQPGARRAARALAAPGQSASSTNQAMPSESHLPGPLKVTRNTSSIMARKSGIARYLCVATASMRSVTVRCPSRLLRRTEARTTRSTNR